MVGGRWEDFRTAERVKALVARWEEILRQNGAESFERLQAPLTIYYIYAICMLYIVSLR